jgi:hypothetical protein
MEHTHIIKIAQLMAHLTRDPTGEPIVCGRAMSRASTCDLITAVSNESITLGMHKCQYPWEDRRVVDQTAKVQALVEHLRERFECA